MIRAGCTLVAAAVTLGLAAAIKVVRDSRSWRAWDDDDGGPETIEGQLIPMAAWNGYVGNWPHPLGRN